MSDEVVCYNNIISDAVYSLISEKGNDRILFLGNGKMLSNGDYSIESKTKTNAVLEFKNGELYLSCESPVLIKLKGKKKKIFPKQDYQKIKI